jgi:hypothetical protein
VIVVRPENEVAVAFGRFRAGEFLVKSEHVKPCRLVVIISMAVQRVAYQIQIHFPAIPHLRAHELCGILIEASTPTLVPVPPVCLESDGIVGVQISPLALRKRKSPMPEYGIEQSFVHRDEKGDALSTDVPFL